MQTGPACHPLSVMHILYPFVRTRETLESHTNATKTAV